MIQRMGNRLKLAIPNLVSLSSMGLALASVVVSSNGGFVWAAWLIVWSTILDKLDGAAARALGAGSAFGVEMDSFCDFAAFGIAPGALTWYLGAANGGNPIWFAVAGMAWPMAASLRLARFNVAGFEDHDYFTGVPTTFAAGIFAALMLTLTDLGLQDWQPRVLPSVALAFAVLMLSGVRLPKIKKRESRAFNLFQGSMTLLCVVVAILRTLPEVLLVLSVGYLFFGPLLGRKNDPQRHAARD